MPNSELEKCRQPKPRENDAVRGPVQGRRPRGQLSTEQLRRTGAAQRSKLPTCHARQVVCPAYGMRATPATLRRAALRMPLPTGYRQACCRCAAPRDPWAEADTTGCLKPLSRPLQAAAPLTDTPRPSRPEVGYDPWALGDTGQPPCACSPLQPHLGRRQLLRPTPMPLAYGNPRGQRGRAAQQRAPLPQRRCPLWTTRWKQSDPFSPALKKQLRAVLAVPRRRTAMRRALPTKVGR